MEQNTRCKMNDFGTARSLGRRNINYFWGLLQNNNTRFADWGWLCTLAGDQNFFLFFFKSLCFSINHTRDWHNDSQPFFRSGITHVHSFHSHDKIAAIRPRETDKSLNRCRISKSAFPDSSLGASSSRSLLFLPPPSEWSPVHLGWGANTSIS